MAEEPPDPCPGFGQSGPAAHLPAYDLVAQAMSGLMAATALLKQNPKPSDAQIEAAMVNLCRCGTYNAIHAAMHELAGKGEA